MFYLLLKPGVELCQIKERISLTLRESFRLCEQSLIVDLIDIIINIVLVFVFFHLLELCMAVCCCQCN